MTPAPPWLALADAATRGALVALLLLLGALLARDRARGGRSAIATVGAALAAGLVVQVLLGLPGLDASLAPAWLALPIGVSVANSMLFWLFALALFYDDFRPRRWHAALWAAVVAVGALGAVFCGPGWVRPGDTTHPLVWLATLKGGLPLVFGLLALWATARQWQADLVEGRRRVRLFVVAAGVLDTLAMVLVRLNGPPGRIAPLAAWLDVAMLLLIVAVVALHLLQLGELGELGGMGAADARAARAAAAPAAGAPAHAKADPWAILQTNAQAEPPPNARAEPPPNAPSGEPSNALDDTAADALDDALIEALARAMSAEHVYRESALSVAALAAHLRVPEYRLRRAINRRLGFRNFNAYVNGYRLAAARQALADPQRRDQAVLAIALEVGFGSIGPFNRAFKAETGLTPTEFRRQSTGLLADS